jgi:signal peptidase I
MSDIKNFINRILFGGGIIFDLLKWVILVAVIVILIFQFWLSVFIVDGLSMYPTLNDKEVIVMQRNSYNSKNPARGDIVGVKYPGDPVHKKYVKRVVGLPGETLSIQNGKVYINGKLLPENYLPFNMMSEPDEVITLSSDQYFLMGDNRPNSNDSRYFGSVEKRFIEGRALYIIYPRFLVF